MTTADDGIDHTFCRIAARNEHLLMTQYAPVFFHALAQTYVAFVGMYNAHGRELPADKFIFQASDGSSLIVKVRGSEGIPRNELHIVLQVPMDELVAALGEDF